MTIMDVLNQVVVDEGGTPSGGSIVDVLNAAAVANGGQPTGGSIADAIINYKIAKANNAGGSDTDSGNVVKPGGTTENP